MTRYRERREAGEFEPERAQEGPPPPAEVDTSAEPPEAQKAAEEPERQKAEKAEKG